MASSRIAIALQVLVWGLTTEEALPSEDEVMTKITFIDRRNQPRSIDADNNSSVMRAAVSHGVKGIAAECGGNGICAN
jgi:hypothetical protein